MKRILFLLLTLVLVGCNTEEKPIYLDCYGEGWEISIDGEEISSDGGEISTIIVEDYRSILLIDKQNGLIAEKDLTPELPKKYQYYVSQLYMDDKYYGEYDGDNAVPYINRFTLEVTEDSYVDECVVSENQYPELRAEAIKIYKDQTTPKI